MKVIPEEGEQKWTSILMIRIQAYSSLISDRYDV